MGKKPRRTKQTAIQHRKTHPESDSLPLPIIPPVVEEITIPIFPENIQESKIPSEIFMLHTLTGFRPQRDTISATSSYMDQYEPQRVQWETTIHPMTSELIKLTQRDFEQKGLLINQRNANPGKRILDMLLVPGRADNERGNIINELNITPESLVEPMRQMIQSHAMASGLNAINRACNILEASTKGKKASILFFSSVESSQQDAILHQFFTGDVLKTLQSIYLYAYTLQQTKRYGENITKLQINQIAEEALDMFNKVVLWPASAFTGQDMDALIKKWQGMDTRSNTREYMSLEYQIQKFQPEGLEVDTTPQFQFIILVGPRRV